jgi:hypothetical protein
MGILERDEQFLNEKAYRWSVVPDGGESAVLLQDFAVASHLYDRDRTDLLIRIPTGYNNAPLDMYFVDPPLRLKTTSGYPDRADHFENIGGRRWQRFSRHMPEWRAGLDCLRTYMPLIQRELQAKG